MADNNETQLAAIQQAIRIMDDSSPARLRAILGATKIHDHLRDDPATLRRKLVDATAEHHYGAWIAAQEIIKAAAANPHPHDRIITPDNSPDRFTEDEAEIYHRGRCGWIVESGTVRGIVYCLGQSKPGASFGNCEEHDEELLMDFWPDGTPRNSPASR